MPEHKEHLKWLTKEEFKAHAIKTQNEMARRYKGMSTEEIIVAQIRERARLDFKLWIEANPNGTLGQLQTWLVTVERQLFAIGDEPLIEVKIPKAIKLYLSFWDDPDEGTTGDDRQANAEEDIERVEGLIEDLGWDFKASEL